MKNEWKEGKQIKILHFIPTTIVILDNFTVNLVVGVVVKGQQD
jgi:hypothetical protein